MKFVKLLLIMAVMMEYSHCLAYDFEVDGLCYNIISDDEVEITYIGSNKTYSGNLTIPETVKYRDVIYKVTTIGERAFDGSSLLKGPLVIPNSVTTIKELAFSGCSGFTSLEISNSVISIGRAAFYGCSGLSGLLKIPNSVTTIYDQTFRRCSGLTSLDLPSSLTTIDFMAFDECSGFTGSLIIPNSVTSIKDEAFSG